MDHTSRRPAPSNHRSFSVEDAEQELDANRASSSARHRPVSSRRRSRQRPDRPSVAEVHFTDDPSVGATSTPVNESRIHVHHHHGPHGIDRSPPSQDGLGPEDVSRRSEHTDETDGDDSGSTLIHTTDGDDDFDDTSDTASIESFTLRERQDAINETHPFGIRIWKPALYKKSRSVQRIAEGDIHSTPGKKVSWVVWVGNYFWSAIFGIPLWIIIQVPASFCFLFFFWSVSAREYGRAFCALANYFVFPFGKFVQLDQDEHYALEDEGEGRSLGEYEEWRTGADRGRLFFGPSSRRPLLHRARRQSGGLEPISESDGLLNSSGNPNDGDANGAGTAGDEAAASSSAASVTSIESGMPYATKRRLFGRGQWNLGRIIFYTWFYLLVYPALLVVAGICWFMVFAIPMARVTIHLCSHLRRHPLALSFHHDGPLTRNEESPENTSILVCTYRAFGWNYYKYTVDGTNVFLMNLMFVVVFTIFDQYLITKVLGPSTFVTTPGMIFVLALCSVIPLAYFIGQAVASISAQSSMGMGAAINAFFSTIVEVFLYCVALTEGKGRLVEGSVIGSILAGVLVMPGLSMCSGAIKRKTQRYNPKSAGVSSTMLLFAVIAAFAPTLFYQIYGSYQLNCVPCTSRETPEPVDGVKATCRRCQFFLDPLTNDDFYQSAVKPFTYLCAVLLFVSYVIGLWFTLRTHAAMIWQANPSSSTQPVVTVSAAQPDGEAVPADGGPTALTVNDSLYDDVYGSINSMGGAVNSHKFKLPLLGGQRTDAFQDLPLIDLRVDANGNPIATTTTVPASAANGDSKTTKSTAAAPTATGVLNVPNGTSTGTTPRRGSLRNLFRSQSGSTKSKLPIHELPLSPTAVPEPGSPTPLGADAVTGEHHAGGGHDAPNWSRLKSTIVLLGATILYAVVAEILVDTVDVVLDSVAIDEKFLGITLFALVPNTTEFLNAISFAMNGNIALSMEIGSAYVLQVCLLQIPALILFSVWNYTANENLRDYTFSLVFPRWDLVVVVLCVFLLSYIYAEGRSNYFKGSILLLSYLVVMGGFWFSGTTGEAQISSSMGGGPVFIVPGLLSAPGVF
ncbi:Sodium/calcium exchanger protein-domain-containing protein [Lipomyces tetrasporus]|uniref:Sodium/calcium exchanger protein-domain-containing protein n=1 Tax=Lipomyces tetrasporus TaxID=54092 RepID=A0AAD7VTF3_9ASCO|nr:Sodium/calcium exchanger protein-domain-containing protein [Lipomyces tetrasporus]KAJ8100674.1 Sodium/calcium exchanger protein-domain-containing protein [Lipomyces tetrasporus]